MGRHEKLAFEYSEITPQIFIGTNQCCVMHFARELIKKGIRADVSLEEKRIDAPFGAQYYLWLPVKDHTAPTMKQFDVGLKFLDQIIRDGEKVYVHCEHGHGRAPTLVAAYLALYQNMTVEEALQLIKKQRPATHPNKKQMGAIKKFVSQYSKMMKRS